MIELLSPTKRSDPGAGCLIRSYHIGLLIAKKIRIFLTDFTKSPFRAFFYKAITLDKLAKSRKTYGKVKSSSSRRSNLL